MPQKSTSTKQAITVIDTVNGKNAATENQMVEKSATMVTHDHETAVAATARSKLGAPPPAEVDLEALAAARVVDWAAAVWVEEEAPRLLAGPAEPAALATLLVKNFPK